MAVIKLPHRHDPAVATEEPAALLTTWAAADARRDTAQIVAAARAATLFEDRQPTLTERAEAAGLDIAEYVNGAGELDEEELEADLKAARIPAPVERPIQAARRLGAAAVIGELFDDSPPSPSPAPLPASTCALCGLSRQRVRRDVRLCVDCGADIAASRQRVRDVEDATIRHAEECGAVLEALEAAMTSVVAEKYALYEQLLRDSPSRWRDAPLIARVEKARRWAERPGATDDDRAFVALIDAEQAWAQAAEQRVTINLYAHKVRSELNALEGVL